MRVVDEALLLVALEVRDPRELEPSPETRELGVFAERVEVEFVRAPHHDAVELHVLRAQGDLARLDRELKVLERVERPLQEIAELEEAASGVDELSLGLVKRHGLQRRRERL